MCASKQTLTTHRARKRRHVFEKQTLAAVAIQRIARGWLGRQSIDDQIAIMDQRVSDRAILYSLCLTDTPNTEKKTRQAFLERKAVLVQSIYRGHMTRRLFWQQFRSETVAATTIQRYARRRLAVIRVKVCHPANYVGRMAQTHAARRA